VSATRERLEAVIRAELTLVMASACTGMPYTAVMNRATETILREVDEYTDAEVGLLTPAERRRVIEEAAS
jgi:hypothetical protein